MRRRARAALECIRLNCRRRVHKRSRQQKRGLHSESQREWRGRLKGRRSQNRECRWDDWNSPRFPHNPRILCDEDAQNDAQAAREAEESQSFSREPADHGGEDAFKRKDHRSLCGRHVFLRPSQKKLCTVKMTASQTTPKTRLRSSAVGVSVQPTARRTKCATRSRRVQKAQRAQSEQRRFQGPCSAVQSVPSG